ncbi:MULTISPECIES: acetyl-CoA C-acetyltransferase [unclassified Arthrobacter]|uniref:acetyl-CoA C-acetyltransferase n=1 Tax=unclassified Arthrobacter TaxID=235627 RepID=UPI001E2E445D|nr:MULTISPECIES: acetyl-CoA C-acetyltransferase [unclassified Arthrobacter]MCC9145411.1 acetyl-CoA C-acetyltransferase [Arthrobacter sp. zg-Y919]MDK1276639.1 acetyl-CoA C-acetyltransferase [Arthrobacter sp. zg.Y919]MDM7989278.1 acetyl-CoA C-acetyltransferase [Arthrobacter sp. zg-Y877]WIB04412.1 acetyl-CoA C-acetyltransferase [Arthrobacter sp. zg-Y919]
MAAQPEPARATPTNNAAGSSVRKAVVIGGNRIPFARSGGKYTYSSNQDMLTAALDGLVARFGLQGERIGEVAGGAVLKHSRDFNLTREAVLGSALSPETPAYDVQQACATGLETVVSLANKIKLGQLESAIAGGVDSASDAPIAVSEGLRRALLDLSRARTTKQKLAAVARIRPKDLSPNAPSTGEPRTGLSMGEHQALTTAQWKITREAQDELAFNSHRNMAAAYDRGFFDDLVTPYRGLAKDANLRPDTSMEKLAKLKPAFGKSLGDEATMTAGNSTPLTDGASVVLLGSEDYAREHDLPMLANIVDAEAGAVDFVHGKDGLLMAPAFAVPRLLARHNLTFDDFDFFEIHEAFAGTVLSTLAAWEDEEFCRTRLGLDAPLGSIDRTKLNVNGSSLAAGHPFAATGGRIVASLAKMLHEKGSGRGLISICAAGGQGLVAILEAR